MINLGPWPGKTGKVDCFGVIQIDYEKLVNKLGVEHLTESDPGNTHSGVERYWAFELDSDTVLAFRFHDLLNSLYVGSNKDITNPIETVKNIFDLNLESASGKLWE